MDANRTGRELLARQWIIGRISEVHPFTARVRLMSDPTFTRQRVRLAKPLADGALAVSDRECLLYGASQRGHMTIIQAPADFYKEGYTAVLIPAEAGLPSTFLAGFVTGSTPVPNAPLHFDLDVAPPAAARELTRVFVLSTAQE
jgi:hypothetical protein